MIKFVPALASLALVACADIDAHKDDSGGAERNQETASREGAQDYELSEKRLSIEVEPGHNIEYLLGDLGESIITETGTDGEHTPLVETQQFDDVVEVYRSLHPEAEVPAEIVSFAERMNQVKVNFREVPSNMTAAALQEAAPDNTVQKHATSDANHFKNEHWGCFSGPNDYFVGCLTNRTGDFWVKGASRWAIFKLGLYRGTAVFKATAGSASTTLTVNQGQFKYVVGHGTFTQDCSFLNGCSRPYATTIDHRMDLLEAAGDGWHVGWRLHNLRHASGSCAEVNTTDAPKYAAMACLDHYGNIY